MLFIFWQMVDALAWLAGAVMLGGTAWAAWYWVTDSRSGRPGGPSPQPRVPESSWYDRLA